MTAFPTHTMQHTLAGSVGLKGIGFWEGRSVRVTLRPAAEGTGIRFRRVDLPEQPLVPAKITAVASAQYRTRLAAGVATVDMTEHLLSALYAAGVDNCEVQLDAQELPAFDGSAAAYLEAIDRAGIVGQNQPRRTLAVESTIRVGDDQRWILITPNTGGDALVAEYRLDYGPGSVIAPCSCRATIDRETFAEQIAAARTFVTDGEARHIQSLGMAKHVTHQDLLVFDASGPISNHLRFSNETARHKLLDLVGDLALAGVRIHARVTAYRSGHALNAAAARVLYDLCQRHRQTSQQQAA